jgi:hypothetical protein
LVASLLKSPEPKISLPVEQTLEQALRGLGVEDSSIGANLSLPQRAAVSKVVTAVAYAEQVRDQVFAPFENQIRTVFTDPVSAPVVLAGLDRSRLVAVQRMLIDTAQEVAPVLASIHLAQTECTTGNIVCIGTPGSDTWSQDVQVLIDPAGDDLYLNNAGGSLQSFVASSLGGCALGGGTTGRSRPNLNCTPVPSNICTYDTLNKATEREDLPVIGIPGHADPEADGDGADGSCGSDQRRERASASLSQIDDDADARGVTMLLDLDGADTYTHPWVHEDPLFNLIEDCFPGETSKVNTNRDFIQGSSLAGVALTWDTGDGSDVFRGRLNSQGSGHVGGLGTLIVDGAGDTTFWADRLSQANGIAAGIGVLINNATGIQRYLLDPPVVYRNEFSPNARDCQQEGRAGQGQGGFAGIGVLITAGGTDSSYRAVTHATTNSYPYNALLDSASRPILARGTDAQGSGESFPISATSGGMVAGAGLLIDSTNADSRVCSGAGMLTGSTMGAGISLDSMGNINSSCGKFNIPAAAGSDIGQALQRLAGGALGVRVVLP